MSKMFLIIACGSGAMSVILGAFAAHALKTKLPENLFATFEVGVRYQFYHTLALLAVGMLLRGSDLPILNYAGWGFISGIVLFSFTLYLYALTGMKFWAMITPIGGVLFIAAWVLMLVGVLRS